MDELTASELIADLLALAGIGDSGFTQEVWQRLKATATRARAYLAAYPEPAAGLTDEELLSVDDLQTTWNAQADAANSWDELGIDEIVWWAQRQALARWGHQPTPEPAAEGQADG